MISMYPVTLQLQPEVVTVDRYPRLNVYFKLQRPHVIVDLRWGNYHDADRHNDHDYLDVSVQTLYMNQVGSRRGGYHRTNASSSSRSQTAQR
jgi:hypothetical protein